MIRSQIAVLGLVCMCLAVPVLKAPGQEENPAGQPGTIILRATSVDGVGLEFSQAFTIQGLNGLQIFGAQADPYGEGMLREQQVQQELGLVEEQINQIRQIQQEFREQMKERSDSIMSNGKVDPAKAKQMNEEMTKVRATMKKKLDGVLLPHQQKRLQQISFHREMESRPGGQAILNGRLADELELTPEQREKLSERATKIQAELQEKIAELQKKAREDLLSGLSKEQREKLTELLGEEATENSTKANPVPSLRQLFGGAGGEN